MSIERPLRPLMVGDVLYGYCGGYFGRDSYEDKRVEARGADWIVCRDDRGRIHFTSGGDIDLRLGEYRDPPIDEWDDE